MTPDESAARPLTIGAHDASEVARIEQDEPVVLDDGCVDGHWPSRIGCSFREDIDL